MKTAEEFFKEKYELLLKAPLPIPGHILKDLNFAMNFAKEYHDYASQFPKSSELSDEEIEKEADRVYPYYKDPHHDTFVEAAKWARSKLSNLPPQPVKDAQPQWVDAKKEMPAEGKQVLLQIWYMDGNNHKEAFEFTIGFQIADKWHFKPLYGTPVKWQYISPPTKK